MDKTTPMGTPAAAAMSDEEALSLVAKQGFGQPMNDAKP
jgi:hypothetical protein